VQQTFDALAYEVSFARALVVRDLRKFGHQVIVQGDRDLRHGHIMPQIEVRFTGPGNLKERDDLLDLPDVIPHASGQPGGAKKGDARPEPHP
jgi:hypothetical protein